MAPSKVLLEEQKNEVTQLFGASGQPILVIAVIGCLIRPQSCHHFDPRES